MVPSGWTRTLLGDVAEFKNGLNFTKVDDGELIKIVGVGDFKGFSQLEKTDHLESVRVANKVRDDELLQDGDLLFVRSNGNKDLIGRCLFFPSVKERLAFSGFTIRGRLKIELIYPEYASYIARSSLFKQQISRNGGGTNISNLSQQILNDISFGLPPLPEQKKIAQILSTWDKAITTTEQLLANSQQQKKALMQQLLTGKKRLRDKNEVRFSGEWVKVKYANLVNHKSGNSKLIKGNLSSNPLKNGYAGYSASGQDLWLEDYEYDCDAIIVSAVGSRCGKCFYATGKWSAIANTHVIFPKKNLIDVYFLNCHINNEHFWIRGGSGQPFVKIKDSLNRHILLPNINEQRRIAAVLSTADQEITALQQKIESLKTEKKALMQQLLTGKRRVKIEDKEVA